MTESIKYLLIGGGLAAIRAASQIRMLDPDASIMMISQESQLPYDRPPLSKAYLAGEIQIADILLETADALDASRLRYTLSQTVMRLDTRNKSATLGNGEIINFDKALIATGGRPIPLDVEGVGLDGIHYLRTIADADAIRTEAVPGRKAILIGGGFIGLETAATLCKLGVSVTVIETMPRIWTRFANKELSAFITEYCVNRGVEFINGTTVQAFRGNGRVEAVITSTGDVLECDMICIGIGIHPNVELAADSGIVVDDGIVVDERMRTSHPDIFAAGDVVNYPDPLFNRRCRSEHWGHAEHSGQIAGRNMAGGNDHYDLLSYAWSDIFDIHVEFAGNIHVHNNQLLRGSVTNESFMIIYLDAGKVTAFLAINTPAREYAVIRRMIQNRTDVSGREAQLGDTSINLRSLL